MAMYIYIYIYIYSFLYTLYTGSHISYLHNLSLYRSPAYNKHQRCISVKTRGVREGTGCALCTLTHEEIFRYKYICKGILTAMCSLSNINSSIKHTYYSLSLDLLMYGLFKKYFVKIKNLYSPYEN